MESLSHFYRYLIKLLIFQVAIYIWFNFLSAPDDNNLSKVVDIRSLCQLFMFPLSNYNLLGFNIVFGSWWQ